MHCIICNLFEFLDCYLVSALASCINKSDEPAVAKPNKNSKLILLLSPAENLKSSVLSSSEKAALEEDKIICAEF